MWCVSVCGACQCVVRGCVCSACVCACVYLNACIAKCMHECACGQARVLIYADLYVCACICVSEISLVSSIF